MKAWLRQPLSFGLWLATCAVIGLLFAGGLVLYEQIRSNRVETIRKLCEHDNANAQHNIDFLHRVSPDLMPLARQVFKQTPNCHAFAVKAVHAESR
jgi:hypothetical protein